MRYLDLAAAAVAFLILCLGMGAVVEMTGAALGKSFAAVAGAGAIVALLITPMWTIARLNRTRKTDRVHYWRGRRRRPGC